MAWEPEGLHDAQDQHSKRQNVFFSPLENQAAGQTWNIEGKGVDMAIEISWFIDSAKAPTDVWLRKNKYTSVESAQKLEVKH